MSETATRRIVCAGLRRSGSTWLFNAVRLILEQTGESVYGCFVDRYKSENLSPIHVVKTHKYLDGLRKRARHTFMTYRDLRDIAASAVRMRLTKNSAPDIGRYLRALVAEEYNPWSPHADLQIPYEDMLDRGPLYLRQISELLAVKIDPQKVYHQLEAIRTPPTTERTYDKTTLLWPNHITDGRPGSYRDTLSPEVVTFINTKFGPWLESHGYESTCC